MDWLGNSARRKRRLWLAAPNKQSTNPIPLIIKEKKAWLFIVELMPPLVSSLKKWRKRQRHQTKQAKKGCGVSVAAADWPPAYNPPTSFLQLAALFFSFLLFVEWNEWFAVPGPSMNSWMNSINGQLVMVFHSGHPPFIHISTNNSLFFNKSSNFNNKE